MSRTFIERAHEEIRLSVSSAQMAVIHDSFSAKFRSAMESSANCPSDLNPEPSSKRRRISETEASSSIRESGTEASHTVEHNANLLALISNVYELFIISASRSSLLSKEWSNLSLKISSFGGEIINTILVPTLQRWPPTNSSKNRFRKLKNTSEQTVLASAFRILASVVQVQGLHNSSELDALDLSEWVELLQQVSGRKTHHLNPELSFELIHLCLEFTSQQLSCLKTVDPTIPRTAYDTIFKLMEDCTDLSETRWNGSVLSLLSAELPLALWHYLTTAHLSEFSTLATPEQANRFSQTAVRFESQSLPPQPTKPLTTGEERFSFLGINRMALRSPLFLECTSLRDPLLERLLAAFEAIRPLGDEAAALFESDHHVDNVIYLYDFISDLPLSYLTKWARKRLFNWSFVWNEALLSQEGTTALTSKHYVSLLRSRVFLCRLLSDPLSSASAEMMRPAVTTTIKFLNPCSREEDEDSLLKVTEQLISGILIKLMKNMKSGDDSVSSFNLLEQFCKALAQRIKHAAKTIIQTQSIGPENRLIVSPLQAMADYGTKNILNSNREASGDESVFIQRFQQLIQPLLDNLESALKKTRAKTSSNPSNLGLLQLGKIYLQLCRIEGSQSRFMDSLIDLKLLLPSIDEMKEYRMGSDASDSQAQNQEILPECLDLFEEMIQIHRHRYGTKPRDCVNAFQTLVISHVHLRTRSSTQDDFDLKLRRSFIRSCKNAHPNESREALRMVVNEILRSSHRFVLSNPGQFFHLGSPLFTRSRILTDVAALLILNYPGHDTHDSHLNGRE